MSHQESYDVAYEYTVRFYPRFFSWTQFHINSDNLQQQPGSRTTANRLTGPEGMGPEYKVVVAINVDTIYAEAFLDVSLGPVYLTVPKYGHTWSVLHMDVYGDVFSTALSEAPPSEGATYAFVAPGYSAPLPDGVIRAEVPYGFTTIAIRIDTHTSDGVDVTAEAEAFRRGLSMQTTYDDSEGGREQGRTLVLPLVFFSPSVKLMADEALAASPEAFLATLQEAMASRDTQPITDDDRALMRRFDQAFAAARTAVGYDSRPLTAIVRGAQDAWTALVNRWQSHRGPTNWIHFDNIGDWGTSYLDRAALTEYIQCGNDYKAAYYADAFVDGTGLPLDGGSHAYVLRFEKDELPKYKRFWSLTAYTPGAVELVPNAAEKYAVASYTEGLVTAEDGSVTIYVQPDEPKTAPAANWLPVPRGPFSLLFRVYGPEGTALAGTYVVPRLRRALPR